MSVEHAFRGEAAAGESNRAGGRQVVRRLDCGRIAIHCELLIEPRARRIVDKAPQGIPQHRGGDSGSNAGSSAGSNTSEVSVTSRMSEIIVIGRHSISIAIG